ncbi:MAG: Fic family protein [Endomicrobium sp.]|jgi:cell filamentation protein|nr:Fic family protein [Endomicrobium sp.]
MNNSYEYIDPDHVYTDAKTGVLRNLGDIDDKNALSFFESAAVAKRASQLKDKPLKIKNSHSLIEIHKFLFQDVYEWAGKVRTVEISKGDKGFLPTSRFDTGFSHIDILLEEYRKLPANYKMQIAHKLAEILDAVNFLHPFREGNGRAQREFIRTLAIEKGIDLHLNPPDNKDVYERYMSGTINGDIKSLADLISKLAGK